MANNTEKFWRTPLPGRTPGGGSQASTSELESSSPEPPFGQQVLACSGALAIQARYLSRNRIEAEDLVQEVVMRALLHRDQFQRGTNLKAWLRTIMRNTFLLRRRTFTRECAYDPDRADRRMATVGDPTINMQLDEVRRALALLPQHYHDILTLAAGGSSYDEMSYVLGCAMGTVKSRLSRARDLLQAVLDDGGFKALPSASDPLARLETDYAALTGAAKHRARVESSARPVERAWA